MFFKDRLPDVSRFENWSEVNTMFFANPDGIVVLLYITTEEDQIPSKTLVDQFLRRFRFCEHECQNPEKRNVSMAYTVQGSVCI